MSLSVRQELVAAALLDLGVNLRLPYTEQHVTDICVTKPTCGSKKAKAAVGSQGNGVVFWALPRARQH